MDRVLVLVDFDNCRNDRLSRAIGRGTTSFTDYESVFADLIEGVVSSKLVEPSGRREVKFRFYGGWFDSQTSAPTDLHQMLIQCIKNYPKRTLRQNRLAFEVATAPLFCDEYVFNHTLRTEAWNAPEGRVSANAACGMTGRRCSQIDALETWLRGRCPQDGCQRRLTEVANRRGQKLVDTLIVADSVIASSSGQYEHIAILTADDDMVPGLIFRRKSSCELSVVRLNYSDRRGRYDNLLESFGVAIHHV